MLKSIGFIVIVLYFLIQITSATSNSLRSIVIQVPGDCNKHAKKIAEEHGYRFVREIFDGYCEIEEDPSSPNHIRHRRAIQQGIDPAEILSNHEHVIWAESQIPRTRQKRDFNFNDPEWNNMWYLMRNSQQPKLPDLNVTGAWQMGYTGRGRVVTFLDDGLEYDHPDLQENYDKEASTDINGNDDDPTPRYDPTNENKHGTRCAGEVSAKANNQICGVGIAHHARVGGIRMLDGDVTDSVEARSLSHRPDHVEIYSASWGPDDNGQVVDGPGVLATRAFENGALHGRDGKGSIFVWASGNGGRFGDSCACDGYINSIYTIAISSVTENGNKPWYLEECPGTLATTYSSGTGNQDHEIITTDLHHTCTEHHTGTSAAAPIAAAIYALVLEANPNLTWRDIMYITVLGSRPNAIPSNKELVRNAAGFNVSNKYGFGLMDAGLMTWYASGWTNVPMMETCEMTTADINQDVKAHSSIDSSIDFVHCQNEYEINYIEQVQVYINLTTTNRGEIEIYLYSPSGTETHLLPKRTGDNSDKGFTNWPFLTVQLWGEKPHGSWKLKINNSGAGSAVLLSWRLVVHGTRKYPISPRVSLDTLQSKCHIECDSTKPCGTNDTSCTSCRHFKQPLPDERFRCVGICPEGTYLAKSDNLCLSCHEKCGSCLNASENSCVTCKIGYYLQHDTMMCTESCPDKYYTDTKINKCVRCKEDCASCDTSSYTCTTCPPGYALKNTDCVQAAKECESTDYFDFTANLCRWCDMRCLTCSGPSSSNCNSCDKKSKYPYLQTHSCVSACSPGYYFSEFKSECQLCHPTCLTCTSANETSCLTCKIGYSYVPDDHRCAKNTGLPTYIDPKTGEVRACHRSCAQCKGPTPSDCLACNPITEVLLEDGHCANECPSNMYMRQGDASGIMANVCQLCPIGCTECRNADTCTSCAISQGYTLKNERCIPKCKSGEFQSRTTCESCQYPCSTCQNLTSCFTCQDKLYLIDDQCVKQCPQGFYTSKNRCFKCHPLCETCNGPSEDDCQSCAPGFQYDKSEVKCKSLCPNGNFYNNDSNVCEVCKDNCLECLHPGSYCRQCSYPSSLDTITNRCLTCCTTNVTTDSCCQCPSIWDGFCFHPLSSQSAYSSIWWIDTPIVLLRDKFVELDRFHQTLLLTGLILFTVLLGICLVIIVIYQFKSSNQSRSLILHRDVEYTMLPDLATNDISSELEQNP